MVHWPSAAAAAAACAPGAIKLASTVSPVSSALRDIFPPVVSPISLPTVRRRALAVKTASRADYARSTRWRVELVEPGLGEGVIAVLEKQPQIDVLGTGGRIIELCPPVAGDAVGNRLSEHVGEAATRSRQHRLGFDSEGQRLQRSAEKLDHELVDTLGTRPPRLSAAPQARSYAAGQRRRVRFIGAPVQPIAKLQAAAGVRACLRHPHGHDVVVNLVVRRQLDQLYGALPPVVQRLDPQARAQLVVHPIEVVIEHSVALQQPEAVRRAVAE